MQPCCGSCASAAQGQLPAPVGVSGDSLLEDTHAALLRSVPVTPAGWGTTGGTDRVLDSEAEWFWAFDFQRHEYYRTRARLAARSADALVYVEEGLAQAAGAAQPLERTFSQRILPALRESLGHELDPGIDGTAAVTILLLDIRDPMGSGQPPYTFYTGYFDPVNERRQEDLDPVSPRARSNEREMVYVDAAEPADPGGTALSQTLAHETAHLIQWSYDQSEADWLSEGLSELAIHLCGLGHPRDHVLAFLEDPPPSLVTWDGDPADYGKVYLFLLYLAEQAGEGSGWLRRLVADQADGVISLADTIPVDRSLAELMRDFAVALHLDRTELADGRYGLRGVDIGGDAAGPDGFPAPRRERRDPDPTGHLTLENGPWSAAAVVLGPAGGDVELQAGPSGHVCLAAWALPLDEPAELWTACASEAAAARWLAPGGASGTVLVAANGSDQPSELAVSLRPQAAALEFGGRAFLPLALAPR
jgi:hypothetical protein